MMLALPKSASRISYHRRLNSISPHRSRGSPIMLHRFLNLKRVDSLLIVELEFIAVLSVIMVSALWLVVASIARSAAAQYFPPTPEGLTVVDSKHENGVKISYKQVRISLYTVEKQWWTNQSSARHLRNHSRRQVLLGLCSSSPRNTERRPCRPAIPHQHLLLVF